MRLSVVVGILCSLCSVAGKSVAGKPVECESVADPDQGLDHNWCECTNGSCFEVNKESNCKPLGPSITCPTPKSTSTPVTVR
ncbi:hypothetical protein PGQ11_009746 [Apiospora arundinis]|uniref:Secreted protein n=1 Tax=Apiospora arundinis TaxID=335852 RepID=A0ABR2I873_9PEZI